MSPIDHDPRLIPFRNPGELSEALSRHGIHTHTAYHDHDTGSSNAWWTFTAPSNGPIAGAAVLVEWDRFGWRWGYTHDREEEPVAVLPLSGTCQMVAQSLAWLVMGEPHYAEFDPLLDTLGGINPDASVNQGNAMAGFAPRVAVDYITLAGRVTAGVEALLALHRPDGSSCRECGQAAPCSTAKEVSKLRIL